MDKIAQATDMPYKPKPGGHLVKFNLEDADLAELVNHISSLTGKRFIYGAKVRQIKATVFSPEPVTLGRGVPGVPLDPRDQRHDRRAARPLPEDRRQRRRRRRRPTPLYARGEPVPDDDRYVTRLYRLQQHRRPTRSSTLLTQVQEQGRRHHRLRAGQPAHHHRHRRRNIRRMLRIVEEIDVGGAGEQHLDRADPLTARRTTSPSASTSSSSSSGGAGGSRAAPGAARRRGPARASIADERTNSLIIVATEARYLRCSSS